MQYNKVTRAEVLSRRRSREETGTLACVTSFGLSCAEGGGGRKRKWCGYRIRRGRTDTPHIFQDATGAQ